MTNQFPWLFLSSPQDTEEKNYINEIQVIWLQNSGICDELEAIKPEESLDLRENHLLFFKEDQLHHSLIILEQKSEHREFHYDFMCLLGWQIAQETVQPVGFNQVTGTL